MGVHGKHLSLLTPWWHSSGMCSPVSQEVPSRPVLQLPRMAHFIGFHSLPVPPPHSLPPCASWDPFSNKLLAPKSLSQGLFGSEWQFMKTIYYAESISPSTLEHGWFFSVFVIFPCSLSSMLLGRANAGHVQLQLASGIYKCSSNFGAHKLLKKSNKL